MERKRMPKYTQLEIDLMESELSPTSRMSLLLAYKKAEEAKNCLYHSLDVIDGFIESKEGKGYERQFSEVEKSLKNARDLICDYIHELGIFIRKVLNEKKDKN